MRIPVNISRVVTDWCEQEHSRLHGPQDSVLSDLEEVRRASSRNLDHYDNTPVLKSRQHIMRLLLKTPEIGSHADNVDFAGNYLSDVLKLLAGWQVKRTVAQAIDQDDFRNRILGSPLMVGQSLQRARMYMPFGNVTDEAAVLKENLEQSLSGIAERASHGTDWGLEKSPMVTHCRAGEIACCRMFLVAVDHLADFYDTAEQIPLRKASNNTEDTHILYPFSNQVTC